MRLCAADHVQQSDRVAGLGQAIHGFSGFLAISAPKTSMPRTRPGKVKT
jgi:hypothetical protein